MGLAFSAKALGVGLSFLFSVLLARHFTPEVVGNYQVGVTVANVGGAVLSLGLGPAALQLLTQDVAPNKQRGIVLSSTLIPIAVSFVSVALFFTFQENVAGTLGNARSIQWIAVALPALVLVRNVDEMFRAYGRKHYSTFSRQVVSNLVKLLTLGVCVLLAIQSAAAPLFAFCVGIYAAMAVLLVRLPSLGALKLTSIRGDAFNFSDTPRLLTKGFPLLFNTVIWLAISWTDVLMLGWLSNSFETGIYSIARKLSQFVGFPLIGVGAVIPAIAARRYHSGKGAEFEATIRNAARWSLTGGFLIASVLITMPEAALNIFGEEYAKDGVNILVFLCAGQLIHAASGTSGILLNIVERELLLVVSNGLVALTNVMLNFLLIPEWGGFGAAVATSISLGLMNLSHGAIIYLSTNSLWLPNQIGRLIIYFTLCLTINGLLSASKALHEWIGLALGGISGLTLTVIALKKNERNVVLWELRRTWAETFNTD